MADILIKNMEMPKSCNGCKLATHYFTNTHKVRCFINAEMREAEDIESRPSWCPLVALPEHGRLVSEDDVLACINKRKDFANKVNDEICVDLCDLLTKDINGLTTIVEATE